MNKKELNNNLIDKTAQEELIKVKKFTKQDFITLFSFSCSENVENILSNKKY